MMKSIWALLLCLPVTVFAQTALDDWHGDWAAHFSGGNSGTCSLTISSSTTTQAAVSGNCISDSNPQLQNLVSGQVTLNGAMALTAGTSSSGAQFTGTLQGTSGSGQWVNSFYGISGTWTMSKLPAQTTAIVASGLWDYAVYSPYCNHTELGTIDFTYANGAYSIALHTNNGLGSNCQNIGSDGFTGTVASAQDLLTTSQFQDAINAVTCAWDTINATPCGGSLQSVSFASPDSVSGIIIDRSYGSMNFQMTRGASTAPTLNTLAVTRSGSGTITSNTGGINCGTSCWADYTSGTSVSLTATPASGSNFTGWSGDCSGTGSCVVTMDAAKNVTATFNPVPFTVTVTGVTDGIITAPVATVTATINVNTADVGRAGAVYITAWIPASALGTVLPTGSASGTLTVKSARGSVSSMTVAALANVDTSSYVLVQLTTSGWQAVVNGQLIPYTSGTLAEQSAALTILNNTDTASLPGAQICVGYGIGDTTSANAAEMVRNGNMQLIASVPDTNANSASMGSCILSANYTDSWYNANESGWGLTITDHGTNAFVQWYTYDQTGHNQKYVISGGTFSNGKCLFSGDIKRITGPSWALPTFDPTQVTRTTVGSGTIDFCPAGLTAGTIVFDYTAEGVTGSKQLSRLSFGNDVPHWGGTTNTGARDFSDLWWNSSESGWGVSVTQHGNNIFFRVFAYDTDNRPLLFIVPGVTFNSSTSFTGNLVLTSGPWYGATPFDPTRVTRTTAGTATLTFSDANNGVLSYTVNGVTVTKTITRVVF